MKNSNIVPILKAIIAVVAFKEAVGKRIWMAVLLITKQLLVLVLNKASPERYHKRFEGLFLVLFL